MTPQYVNHPLNIEEWEQVQELCRLLAEVGSCTTYQRLGDNLFRVKVDRVLSYDDAAIMRTKRVVKVEITADLAD